MKLNAFLAAILMISLLAGCSLPVNYVARIQDLAAPLADMPVASTTGEELLTQEDAKLIALDNAKAKEADVKGLHIAFEYDDGIPEYDVSFFYLNYEFEYEIHGVSGRIVSYEREKH